MVSNAEAVKNQTEKTRQISQASHDEIARLYTGGINGIGQQIEDMANAIKTASAQQSTSADILAQFEKSMSAQTEDLKKQIQPLVICNAEPGTGTNPKSKF